MPPPQKMFRVFHLKNSVFNGFSEIQLYESANCMLKWRWEVSSKCDARFDHLWDQMVYFEEGLSAWKGLTKPRLQIENETWYRPNEITLSLYKFLNFWKCRPSPIWIIWNFKMVLYLHFASFFVTSYLTRPTTRCIDEWGNSKINIIIEIHAITHRPNKPTC